MDNEVSTDFEENYIDSKNDRKIFIEDSEAEFLTKMPKKLGDCRTEYLIEDYKKICHKIPLISTDGKRDFMLDINKSKINLIQCTLQNRVYTNIVLVRLDIVDKNRTHLNRDKEDIIKGSHIHIYKKDGKNYNQAYLLKDFFGEDIDESNIELLLKKFYDYCNIIEKPNIIINREKGLV